MANDFVLKKFFVILVARVLGIALGIFLICQTRAQERLAKSGQLHGVRYVLLPFYKPVALLCLVSILVELALSASYLNFRVPMWFQILYWFAFEAPRESFSTLFLQKSIARSALRRGALIALIWPLFGALCGLAVIVFMKHDVIICASFHAVGALFNLYVLIAARYPSLPGSPRDALIPFAVFQFVYRSLWSIFYLFMLFDVHIFADIVFYTFAAVMDVAFPLLLFAVIRADSYYWQFGDAWEWLRRGRCGGLTALQKLEQDEDEHKFAHGTINYHPTYVKYTDDEGDLEAGFNSGTADAAAAAAAAAAADTDGTYGNTDGGYGSPLLGAHARTTSDCSENGYNGYVPPQQGQGGRSSVPNTNVHQRRTPAHTYASGSITPAGTNTGHLTGRGHGIRAITEYPLPDDPYERVRAANAAVDDEDNGVIPPCVSAAAAAAEAAAIAAAAERAAAAANAVVEGKRSEHDYLDALRASPSTASTSPDANTTLGARSPSSPSAASVRPAAATIAAATAAVAAEGVSDDSFSSLPGSTSASFGVVGGDNGRGRERGRSHEKQHVQGSPVSPPSGAAVDANRSRHPNGFQTERPGAAQRVAPAVGGAGVSGSPISPSSPSASPSSLAAPALASNSSSGSSGKQSKGMRRRSAFSSMELGLLADVDDMMLQEDVQDLIDRNRDHIISFSQLRVDPQAIIGSGAFSKVFRARYKDKAVAAKFFTRFMELTPEMIRAFSKETATHVRLRHRNIARCFGLCVVPPAVALVTELCEQGSLLSLIEGQRALLDRHPVPSVRAAAETFPLSAAAQRPVLAELPVTPRARVRARAFSGSSNGNGNGNVNVNGAESGQLGLMLPPPPALNGGASTSLSGPGGINHSDDQDSSSDCGRSESSQSLARDRSISLDRERSGSFDLSLRRDRSSSLGRDPSSPGSTGTGGGEGEDMLPHADSGGATAARVLLSLAIPSAGETRAARAASSGSPVTAAGGSPAVGPAITAAGTGAGAGAGFSGSSRAAVGGVARSTSGDSDVSVRGSPVLPPLAKPREEAGLGICSAKIWSLTTKTALACDAAAAVQFLHSHGILHRDIKSPNFVMAADGTLKLTDFGISRVIGSRAPCSVVPPGAGFATGSTLASASSGASSGSVRVTTSSSSTALNDTAREVRGPDGTLCSPALALAAACAGKGVKSPPAPAPAPVALSASASCPSATQSASASSDTLAGSSSAVGRDCPVTAAAATAAAAAAANSPSPSPSPSPSADSPGPHATRRGIAPLVMSAAASSASLSDESVSRSSSGSSSGGANGSMLYATGAAPGFTCRPGQAPTTLMTSMMGTEWWMAPEVEHGAYSFPADVYSLGVVLWEIFSVQVPGPGVAGSGEWVLPETCPDEIRCIVAACTETNPAERPTACDVHAVLQKQLKQFVSVEAQLATHRRRTATPSKRR